MPKTLLDCNVLFSYFYYGTLITVVITTILGLITFISAPLLLLPSEIEIIFDTAECKNFITFFVRRSWFYSLLVKINPKS